LYPLGNDSTRQAGCVVGTAASFESPRGLLMPISIYGEGSWFGEQSIINRKTSYADIVYQSSTEVMSISSEIVLELMETQPTFALYLTRLMD
jgi:CRP-like cAMP-binding protein